MEEKVLEVLAAGCMACFICAAIGQTLVCCMSCYEKRQRGRIHQDQLP
tara:strand:+ start:56 stop:199 length:144 start_codon:yes stop_codon:yes gene_type:complete